MRRSYRAMTAICVSVMLLLASVKVSAESVQTEPVSAEQETVTTEQETVTTEQETVAAEQETAADERYTLDKVVILSRHNIRSPLGGNGSLIGDITAHKWFNWTSDSGELSRRGAILETIMGQYFRLRMEAEGLFPVNYIPKDGTVRFYANSKQRTIATAHYFSAGLLPVANVEVEMHAEYDTMDPVFNPIVHFTSEEYEKDALEEIAQMGEGGSLEKIHTKLTDAIKLLMTVIDPEKTKAYPSGQYGDLLSPQTSITFEVGKEPAMQGAIKTATQLADALTLQYYEEEDLSKAAFGEKLSWEDWLKIHTIVDTYMDMLFGTRLLAINEAHPLLQELRSEMDDQNREFSFLCGHDSNLTSVLKAMGVEPYELPETPEANTPIGSKLVFERWVEETGEAYYKVSLVYQSAEQMRKMTMLSLENPPMSVQMSFQGVEENDDGMMAEADFLALMDRSVNAYDELLEKYHMNETKSAAAAETEGEANETEYEMEHAA